MDAKTWNSLISHFPDPHILQTWEWGHIKSQYGWQPLHAVWYEGRESYHMSTLDQAPEGVPLYAAALVLQRVLTIRGIPTGLKVLYVPKGPLLQDWGNAVLRRSVFEGLKHLARQQRAIFIKIDPDVRLGMGIPGQSDEIKDPLCESVQDELTAQGWCYSNEQVQFANTVMIDLSQPEEGLLARMKPKTRYNVRLAERKGVRIREGTLKNLDLLYRLYAETSARDGFVIRSEDYYRTIWNTFIQAGMAQALIAEVEQEPVAALIVFKFQRKAWFLFGMSREIHRDKMPNYLLQWEAMQWCKQDGCLIYDLWGAPDRFDDSDPLWGVYRFKDGLGGQVVRHIGAWDLPIRQFAYRVYNQLLPRVLDVMRSRRIVKTKQNLSGDI